MTDLEAASRWYCGHLGIERNGTPIGNWRIDERNGQKHQVFFEPPGDPA